MASARSGRDGDEASCTVLDRGDEGGERRREEVEAVRQRRVRVQRCGGAQEAHVGGGDGLAARV